MEPSENHPLNLNSTDFDPEAYVNNLLKRKGLDELVAVEEDMVQNVRRLDAEMQQLVYENYNKFLTATNTVRNMQIEFSHMDEETKALSDSMKQISTISESLNGVFSKHRENVRKLTDASKTVKSLQYVVKLPQKLQTYIDLKDYKRAVKTFASIKPKLVQYKDIPSMAGIYNDSVEIMGQLEQMLKERLSSRITSSEEIIDAVKMLRQLEYPEEELEKEMLSNWKDQLQSEMENLERQVDSSTVYADVLEYVDNGCCSFLTNVSLAASLYPQLFKTRREGEMMEMIDQLLHRLEKAVLQRFYSEKNPRECAIYVRALDRIYRKIAASCRLLSGLDFSNMNINLVIKTTKHQIALCRESIGLTVDAVLKEIAKETTNVSSPSTIGSMPIQDVLQYIHKLEQSFLIAVKTSLANLLLFTASDITFAGNDPAHFFSTFGIDVHEEIVIGSIKDLIKLAEAYEKGHGEHASLSPTFYLIFAQFVRIAHAKHVNYLMDLCQEQFRLSDRANKITNQETIKNNLFSGAELLLKKYVEVQGGVISQLLVKSIESRDWLECSEPQSVRAVVKKVIEYIESIDQQIKPLMEHDTKKERTPESIRSAGSARKSKKNSYDTGSLSSALEKLWNERVDYFAAVEFKRDSVLTAIVKISLKAYVEVVRLQVFGRHGLEQMQIDCCYLKQYLWKYMMDEHALNSLVDEVVSSVVNQCVDPKILDPAFVKRICESD